MFQKDKGILNSIIWNVYVKPYTHILNLFLRLMTQLFNDSTQVKNNEYTVYSSLRPVLIMEIKIKPMEVD